MKDASVTNEKWNRKLQQKERETIGQGIRAEEIRIYSTKENKNERCIYINIKSSSSERDK